MSNQNYQNLFFIIFSMVLVLSSMPAYSQSSQNFYNYNNVKSGDSMSYKVTKIISQSNNLTGSLWLQNNTYYHYVITEGTIFTEKVVGKNTSQNIQQVQTILLVNLPNNTKLESSNVSQEYAPSIIDGSGLSLINGIPIFLYPILENVSYNSLYTPPFATCNHGGCPIGSFHSSTEGDYYVFLIKIGVNLNNPALVMNYSINWRTGWLEYMDYKQNNYEIIINRIHNQLNEFLNALITTIVPTFTFILLFGSGSALGISYVVYLMRKKPNDTYRKYIRTKLKKTRPLKSPQNINKSLEIIDEIIGESK